MQIFCFYSSLFCKKLNVLNNPGFLINNQYSQLPVVYKRSLIGYISLTYGNFYPDSGFKRIFCSLFRLNTEHLEPGTEANG